MKTYLEYKDKKSAKFWMITLEANTYTTTYGKIGTKGQSRTKTFDTAEEAQKNAEKLIAEKKKKGYKEADNDKSSKSNFRETYKLINTKDSNGNLEELIEPTMGDCETILFFESSVILNEDLDDSFVWKFCKEEGIQFDFIVVDANLTVNGCIDLSESSGLIVSGFTKAETLEGGDCEIYIQDGEFDYYVYGHYNHGTLHTGNVKTQFVINSDHDLAVSSDNAIFIDNYSDHGSTYDYYASDIVENFVAGVLDEDEDCLDISKFYDQLKANKKVMQTNAKTAKQKVLGEIAGNRMLEINLHDRKLNFFPQEILKHKLLKKLDLSKNIIKEIPKEIKELNQLEDLNLNRCYISKFPDELFELTNLKKLNIASNFRKADKIVLSEKISQLKNLEFLDVSDHTWLISQMRPHLFTEFLLPNSIAELSNLKTLISDGNRSKLPKSLSKLDKLEKLQITGGSNVWLSEFPENLPKNLKILNVSSNPFKFIPENILEIKDLEELYLEGTLGYVEKRIPDFSKLPKLKILNFNGAGWGRSGHQLPKHEILQELFEMKLDNLEELMLDRWGEDSWNKEGRKNAKPEFFKGIGKFKNLKKLDLSFCGLDSLPEDIFNLKNLESINLLYNSIPESQINKLKENCPNIEIG